MGVTKNPNIHLREEVMPFIEIGGPQMTLTFVTIGLCDRTMMSNDYRLAGKALAEFI